MTAASSVPAPRSGRTWRESGEAGCAAGWKRHCLPLLVFSWVGVGCAPAVTSGGAAALQPPSAVPAPASTSTFGTPSYRGLDAQGAWADDALLARLSRRRVVCLGERHPVRNDHLVQADVVRLLSTLSRQREETLAVGFEMFQLPAQDILDRYAQGRASEAELLSESEYEERWGFDFELYRPILEAAQAGGAALLALNAPREWTRTVARKGLEQTAPELREQFPELVLDDREHQEFFQRAMAHHPHSAHSGHGPHVANTGFYAAQVLWDETMAEHAAAWLHESGERARLVIIAGAGHCHRSAIPRRLARRLREPVLAVRIVNEEELRQSSAPADSQFDLLLITEAGASSGEPPTVRSAPH